jgi:hypothetical protein
MKTYAQLNQQQMSSTVQLLFATPLPTRRSSALYLSVSVHLLAAPNRRDILFSSQQLIVFVAG